MTTIRRDGPYATLINVFIVEPGNAAELTSLLASATEDFMQHQPGFLSANIHLSRDRTRVVNYARWQSPEHYRAMLSDDTSREHMATAAALGISFDPHLYTVESVHERDR
jgi:heme-degrading monooxygenase HmoA